MTRIADLPDYLRPSQLRSVVSGHNINFSWTGKSTRATSVQRPEVQQLVLQATPANTWGCCWVTGRRRCVADVPGEIAEALGLGALTALLKENGRIRSIVTGDTFRRGVARTLAQQ